MKIAVIGGSGFTKKAESAFFKIGSLICEFLFS